MAGDVPFFSIVIPVYNRADTVLQTLRSCADQTFKGFEVIVVDDGSNDAEQLEGVVRSLADPRFRYVWQPNKGVSAARNKGIGSAIGKYVALLDSDDLFLPHKLKRFADHIGQQTGLAGYSYTYVDRGVAKFWIRPSRPIREDEDMGEYLFVSNEFVPIVTIVVDRDLAAKVQFDESLRTGEDFDFCHRLQATGTKWFMIEDPLNIWVDRGDTERLSKEDDFQELTAWLDRTRPSLTPRAQHGFRATVLAYRVAARKPVTALCYLLKGAVRGRVPMRVIARQVVRCYLPRALYRQLVALFVSLAGVRDRN